MAVLPDPESVQIDTQPERRFGIGGWNPRVISSAYGEEGAGLEKLGGEIGSIGAQEQQRNDNLQLAQAHGNLYAQTIKLQADAESSTDPAAVQKMQEGLPDLVNGVRSNISNPRVAAQFDASTMPHVAEIGANLGKIATNLTNQNAVAGYETNSNSIISNAAKIDDEATSVKALDAINPQIAGLVAAKAITPMQAVQYRQRAAEMWVNARYATHLAQAETTGDPADYARLLTLAGLDPKMYGVAAGQPSAATSAPSAPASGATPAPIPAGINADDAETMRKNQLANKNYSWVQGEGSQPDNADFPGMPKGWTPAAASKPAAAPVGPQSYPAMGGGGVDTSHAQVGGSMAWEKGGGVTGGRAGNSPIEQAAAATPYGRIDQPYNRPLDAKGPSGFSPSEMYQFLRSKGASNNEALMLTGAAGNESGYNAGAWHDNSHGYGLFGHNLGRLNLVGLGWQQQSLEALNELRKRPEGAAVAAAQTPQDLAIAEARYEQSQGFTPGRPEGNHNFLGRLHTLQYFSQMADGQFTGSNGAPIAGRLVAGPGQPTIPGAMGLTPMSYPALTPPVGLPVAPPSDASPGITAFPDQSTGIPARAPPHSAWPADAVSIAVNPDGTYDYAMKDGSRQPVPGARATGAPWATLPPPIPGSVASMLPPDKAAELQLKAVNDVQRLQRRDAIASQRDNRADIANITSAVKQMEGGSRLTTNSAGWQQMSDAYAQSPDPQVRLQFATADAIRNNLARYSGASLSDVSTDVANMQGEFDRMVAANPKDPTGRLEMTSAVLQSAKNYLATFDKEAKNDPLSRAERNSVIPPLKPIDPMSPTLPQDMALRVQQAQAAATFSGLQAPIYFRPDEKATLRRMAQVGGDPMVKMAEAVVSTGAAAPQIFKQMGGNADAWYSIGSLALDSNVDHTDTISRIAKYLNASNDKDLSKNLPRFTDGTMAKAGVEDPLGAAAAGLGLDGTARAHATANILMGEAADQAGKSPQRGDYVGGYLSSGNVSDFFKKAYDEALGGHYDEDGTKWGGVAQAGSWRNGYSVIVPSNVRQDKFETILGQINPQDLAKMGPVPKLDGETIDSARLQQGQFIAVPDKADGQFHGKYAINLPNKAGVMSAVETDDGQRFVLDLNRIPDMRNRVPGAFMPEPAKPANPYQRIKGIAPPDEGTVAESGAAPVGTD